MIGVARRGAGLAADGAPIAELLGPRGGAAAAPPMPRAARPP